MIASNKTISVHNRIIFLCDEYNNGDIQDFDGTVQQIDAKGVYVCYFSAFNSRNDFILWKDILAKVDRRRRWIKLRGASYRGNFLEFQS